MTTNYTFAKMRHYLTWFTFIASVALSSCSPVFDKSPSTYYYELDQPLIISKQIKITGVDAVKYLDGRGYPWHRPLRVHYIENEESQISDLDSQDSIFSYAGYTASPEVEAIDDIKAGEPYDGPMIYTHYIRSSDGITHPIRQN